jgi:hypothetical protein
MIAGVLDALRDFQVGDVVDDRAMLALQLVGAGSERNGGSGGQLSRVSVS